MATDLERAFNELDPQDLKAVTAHAVERIRAGQWSEDLADILVRQVDTFHGSEALERFLERVGAELARQQR